MSEQRDMTDPQGRKRPMLDQHGNITVEAIRLYASGALGPADVSALDELLVGDPFSAEALTGLKGMTTDRFNTNMREVDNLIVERLGVAPDSKLEEDSPWLRMAATLLILFGIGGVTWLGVQYLPRLKPDLQDMGQVTEEPVTRTRPPVVDTRRSIRPNFDVTGVKPALVPEPGAQEAPATEDAQQIQTVQAQTTQLQPQPVAGSTRRQADGIVNSLNKDFPVKMEARSPQSEPSGTAERPISKQPVDQTTTAADDAGGMAMAETLKQESKPKKKKESEVAAAPPAAKRSSAIAEMVNHPPLSDEERSMIPLFNEVQQPPKFPGGDLEMYRYIESNRGFQNTSGNGGNVYVSFVIDMGGKVRNVEISRGISPDLDQDALRLVRSMPAWEPAKQDGSSVSVRKTVMIKYR